MKKFLGILISVVLIVTVIYFSFIYFATFSEGIRSGELIKISKKGVLVKTWEGEISQGISGAQIFSFSVLDKDKQVITDLQKFEGKYIKVKFNICSIIFPKFKKSHSNKKQKDNYPINFFTSLE